MANRFKEYLRPTPLFQPLRMIKGYVALAIELVAPDSPERAATWLYKIFTIRKYARNFGLDMFVETGTNVGDTLNGVRTAFKELHSVELDDGLYRGATERFRAYPNITIHHGTSDAFLKEFVPRLTKPALYWLDAHYSGDGTARADRDSPISEELAVCAKNWKDGSVILIDDAREFDGHHASYPSVPEVEAIVKRENIKLRCVARRGIIRIW
jgi:hypothetical protein